MSLYDLPETSTLFANLDQHVSAILDVETQGPPKRALIDRVEGRNIAMEALADKIVERARSDREAAQNRLIASIARWQLLVLGTGLVTIGVVMLVLLDIVLNVLPAVKRMHGAAHASFSSSAVMCGSHSSRRISWS